MSIRACFISCLSYTEKEKSKQGFEITPVGIELGTSCTGGHALTICDNSCSGCASFSSNRFHCIENRS